MQGERELRLVRIDSVLHRLRYVPRILLAHAAEFLQPAAVQAESRHREVSRSEFLPSVHLRGLSRAMRA